MKYALDVSAVRSIFAYRSDYFPTLQNFSSAWLVSTLVPLHWRNESLKLDFVDFVEKCCDVANREKRMILVFHRFLMYFFGDNYSVLQYSECLKENSSVAIIILRISFLLFVRFINNRTAKLRALNKAETNNLPILRKIKIYLDATT